MRAQPLQFSGAELEEKIVLGKIEDYRINENHKLVLSSVQLKRADD